MSGFLKFLKNNIAKLKKVYSSLFIGMDLGTCTSLVCTNEKGILLNEPSVVSFLNENNIKTNYLYGQAAKDLIGKVPFKIEIVNPIVNGVIFSIETTEKLVQYLLKKVVNNRAFYKSIIICSVPFSANDVERRSLQEILERCNVKKTFLVYKSIANAIGCGLELDKPVGSIIVDIGGGTTEISIISLGGIIKNKSFKYGGRQIDLSIVNFIEKKYSVLIGENVAERIKEQIGCVFLKNDDEEKIIKVQGRDLKTNSPCEITVSQKDIVYATAEFTNLLITNLKQILESTPPELMTDILTNGIIFCGGCAKLQNLDYVVKKITDLSIVVPEHPELCVIKGLEKMTMNIQKYKAFLFQQI